MERNKLLRELTRKKPFREVEEFIYNVLYEYITRDNNLCVGFKVKIIFSKCSVRLNDRNDSFTRTPTIIIPKRWGYEEEVRRFMESQSFFLNKDGFYELKENEFIKQL
jgi:hypothetical protein